MNYRSYQQLLSYPSEQSLNEILHTLDNKNLVGNEKALLNKFIGMTKDLTLVDLEELYTSTFDIQGICCLDLGFILFGEDYKRGEFLVGFSAMQRKYEVDVGTELADHLPNALSLLHILPEGEEKVELIRLALIPAVAKMVSCFTPGDSNCNPYKFILQALLIRMNIELSKMDEVAYV